MPGRAHPAQTGSLASERVQAKAINPRSVLVFGEQEDRIEQDHVHAQCWSQNGDWGLSAILQVWPKGNVKEAH